MSAIVLYLILMVWMAKKMHPDRKIKIIKFLMTNKGNRSGVNSTPISATNRNTVIIEIKKKIQTFLCGSFSVLFGEKEKYLK